MPIAATVWSKTIAATPRWEVIHSYDKGRKAVKKSMKTMRMAEREGFEPPMELPPCRISSAVLSTTQPPLRVVQHCKTTLEESHSNKHQ